MTSLILYEELPPLIKDYAHRVMLRVIQHRKHISARIENAQMISSQLVGGNPTLADQIRQARIRIRNLQRGAALTESFDDEDDSVLDNNLTDADRFLLKKAYRKAAALAHPDKGGDTSEFVAINEAYKAGDLNSLNEYFLLRQTPGRATVEYWLTEEIRIDVQWRKFCTTNEFLLAKTHQQGHVDLAKRLAREILEEHLNRLEEQERILLSPSYTSYTKDKEYEL